MAKISKKHLSGIFFTISYSFACAVQAGNLLQLVSQNQGFTLSKAEIITYGANNNFVEKLLQAGTFNCNDSLFGDPIWGVVKACYKSTTTMILKKLVAQNATFKLTSTSIINYGAKGIFVQKQLQPGSYSCSDIFFGDPLRGVAKNCYSVTQVGSLTQIVGQHSNFSIAAPTTIIYGANGSYFEKTLNSGIYSCNDETFGDPLQGFLKSCYIANNNNAISQSEDGACDSLN